MDFFYKLQRKEGLLSLSSQLLKAQIADEYILISQSFLVLFKVVMTQAHHVLES